MASTPLPFPFLEDERVRANFEALARNGSSSSSSSGTGLDWFDVTDYGAVGDGVTNDTAAFEAAIAACVAAGAGIVYVPAGLYAIASPLTIASWETARVNFMGAGAFTSIIYASADLGADNYLIDYLPPANDFIDSPFCKRRFTGIGLYGGNDLHTQNGAGIRCPSMFTFDNAFSYRFKYGAVTWGNHQTFQRAWLISNSSYGAYLHDDSPTFGDQYFGNSNLTSNTVASIGVGDTHGIFEVHDSHLGFGEYGIYAETSAIAALNRTTITQSYCESFSKGFIYGNGRTINESSVRDTGLKTLAGSAPTDGVIDCGAFQYNRLDHVWLDIGSGGSLPPSFIDATSCISNRMELAQVVTIVVGNDWPLVTCTGAQQNNRITGGSLEGTLALSTEAIASLEALGVSAFDASGLIRGRRAITGDPPLGVAAHGVSATNKAILSITKGYMPGVPAAGAITETDRLRVVSTGDVDVATVGTHEVMGTATAADSGGTVPVQVQTDF